MPKRKVPKRLPPNVAEAQAFSLEKHVDVDREAERFDLPAERVVQIARDVQRETPALVSVTRSESELREVFKALYNAEIANLQVCPWEDCGRELQSIEHAIVHWRIRHLATSKDMRVVRAILKDIEDSITAVDEKTFESVLDVEERQALIESRKRRQMLTN